MPRIIGYSGMIPLALNLRWPILRLKQDRYVQVNVRLRVLSDFCNLFILSSIVTNAQTLGGEDPGQGAFSTLLEKLVDFITEKMWLCVGRDGMCAWMTVLCHGDKHKLLLSLLLTECPGASYLTSWNLPLLIFRSDSNTYLRALLEI